MALNKKKEEKKIEDHEIKVTRAKALDNGVTFFDADVNGVTIYGMNYRILTRKADGVEFGKVGFPSKKSGDQYYNHVFVKFSDADIEEIDKQIDALT